MCLEFYVKSGHILPQNWLDHIVEKACAAFKELFKEFDNAASEQVHDNVNMMKNKAAALALIRCGSVSHNPSPRQRRSIPALTVQIPSFK